MNKKWINANIWIGEEKENSGSGTRLFIDNATPWEIRQALIEHPEITILYFGHGVSKEVLDSFFNKIRIFVEIDSVQDIPKEYLGKIDLILRIPNYITMLKIFDRDEIGIIDTNSVKWNNWDCQKLYKGDKIL